MPEPEVVVHIHRYEGQFQDSVEIGSPSKGGAIKVYFNAANVEEGKERVRNAVQVRDYMRGLVGGV